jgi:hypothetical protein
VSALPDVWDDEELLAALRQALAERQAVPPDFVEAAKNAFAWRSIDIDAELAELTYDSSRDAEPVPTTRAETASIRALTFTSAHVTIELEVTHDSLLGQIVPAQSGTIKVQLRDGAETTVPADGIGRFTIRPMPAGAFRLHCKTSADADALTNWITL